MNLFDQDQLQAIFVVNDEPYIIEIIEKGIVVWDKSETFIGSYETNGNIITLNCGSKYPLVASLDSLLVDPMFCGFAVIRKYLFKRNETAQDLEKVVRAAMSLARLMPSNSTVH